MSEKQDIPVQTVSELLKELSQVQRVMVVIIEREGGCERVVHCDLRELDEAQSLYTVMSTSGM